MLSALKQSGVATLNHRLTFMWMEIPECENIPVGGESGAPAMPHLASLATPGTIMANAPYGFWHRRIADM